MAQRVEVVLVDDLDGGEADQTVEFGLDGVLFVIDLSEGNAERLRGALAEFVARARRSGTNGKASGRTRRSPSIPAVRHSREQLTAVRTWARNNGFRVQDRGRVPQEIWDAFNAAH